MPRGGPRKGAPNTSYQNRTDLNVPYQGQTYGTATQQQEQMRAVPISGSSTPNGMQGPPTVSGNAPKPGSLGPLLASSARPNEPVTSGATAGPGPGLESLGLQSDRQRDYLKLAPYLPVFEHAAAQPNASVSFINFVRRLKAMIG